MNISIINGNGKYVSDAINKTLNSAIKYYGEKYSDIILNTVNETLFYEWEDNQTEADVMFDINDGYVDYNEEDGCELGAFYYLKIKSSDEYDKIVVFRNKYMKDNYHYLVHELFGHGVFGYVDPILLDDCDNIWQRNGVALVDYENANIYNMNLNEGFVEDATFNIMNLAGLRPRWFNYYFETKTAANVIKRYLGCEKLYDSLILNDGDIACMYDEGTNVEEFFQLSMIIDNYMNIGRNPKQNKLFNNNLKRFIKRRKKLV